VDFEGKKQAGGLFLSRVWKRWRKEGKMGMCSRVR
jgi:hypothetical protein